MAGDELEEIKRRKMEELLRAQAEGEIAEAQQRAYEEQRAMVLRQLLTPKAKERLARLRLTRPELVALVEDQIIALAQAGQLRRRVDDETLKGILSRLSGRKREIKIERR
ncbi:MAG: DNA-binding protein [Thermoplasmata archaeon]|nr:DNA-binding protein [Thermoplasmata archaeon]